jgi:hypothetical protein
MQNSGKLLEVWNRCVLEEAEDEGAEISESQKRLQNIYVDGFTRTDTKWAGVIAFGVFSQAGRRAD